MSLGAVGGFMGKAVGVTSFEEYSIAGEIILGLKAMCLQLSLVICAYDLCQKRPVT